VRLVATALPEVLVVEPRVHRDGRGFFLESFHAGRYAAHGIPPPPEAFVQDNHSGSARGTLRGLHLQQTRPQGKLVRVVRGEVFDVAVDVRRGSPTWLRWVGTVLSAENALQCWVPPGFAHGFQAMSEWAEVEYKVTGEYDPADEMRLRWDDPDVGVAWPLPATLSPKDEAATRVRDVLDRLPRHPSAG
jgi:dTDP-4-dehydrorhamnose 3,5-epimerase